MAALLKNFRFEVMKTCFKCGCEKQKTEFYAHKKMADGLLGKCKSCTKTDAKNRRFGENRENILAYDKKRSKEQSRKAANSSVIAKNKRKNRDKTKAQRALQYAVQTKRVVPWPVCAIFTCSKKPEAHHYDYSKPLDVIWLCSQHHRQAHALIDGYYGQK